MKRIVYFAIPSLLLVLTISIKRSHDSQKAHSVLSEPRTEADKTLADPASADWSRSTSQVEASSKQPKTAESDASKAAGAEKLPEMSEQRRQIQASMDRAREAFQKKEAIAQASPEELHHMPQATREAARQLGELTQLELQYPQDSELFRDFYWACAKDEQSITVIRAQCLDNYVKLARLDAAQQKEVLSQFSEAILRLYEALQ